MMPYAKILKFYELQGVANLFSSKNTANDLPYHNAFHAQCMDENCYDGAQYYNLPYDVTKNLLMAALFHDFNHSGGKTNDKENVTRATIDLEKLFVRSNDSIPTIVIECIRCTEFPFVIEPMTIEQRIIRDADLMQFRYPNWQDVIENKLRAEIEVARGEQISAEDMYEGNKTFWSKVKFYTEWGQKMFDTEGLPLREHYKLIRFGKSGITNR